MSNREELKLAVVCGSHRQMIEIKQYLLNLPRNWPANSARSHNSSLNVIQAYKSRDLFASPHC